MGFSGTGFRGNIVPEGGERGVFDAIPGDFHCCCISHYGLAQLRSHQCHSSSENVIFGTDGNCAQVTQLLEVMEDFT